MSHNFFFLSQALELLTQFWIMKTSFFLLYLSALFISVTYEIYGAWQMSSGMGKGSQSELERSEVESEENWKSVGVGAQWSKT